MASEVSAFMGEVESGFDLGVLEGGDSLCERIFRHDDRFEETSGGEGPGGGECECLLALAAAEQEREPGEDGGHDFVRMPEDSCPVGEGLTPMCSRF